MRGLLLAVCAALLLLLVPSLARAQADPPAGIAKAIRLAAITYGVSYTAMVNVARCETGGSFSPWSYNRSSGASGLFQFLRGTWRNTPYGGENVFDPQANALAAAWLVRKDHGWSEWVCRP